jgi:hypothetical protein
MEMKYSCEEIKDETTILAFLRGLDRGALLRHKLFSEHDECTLTLNGMIQTASSYATTDDDARGTLLANTKLIYSKEITTSARIQVGEERF